MGLTMRERAAILLAAIVVGGLFGGGLIYILSRDAIPARTINGYPLSYWINALDSDNSRTKKAAMASVPLFGIEAVRPTIKLLDDPHTQGSAVEVLAAIGRPAIPALLEKLATGPTDTRLAAMHAIDGMPFAPPPPEVLLAVAKLMADDAMEPTALAYVLRVRPDLPATLTVAELLDGGTTKRKLDVLRVIGSSRSNDPRVGEAFLRATGDANVSVQLDAFQRLCVMNPPPAEAADIFVEWLGNRWTNTRTMALARTGLLAIGPPAVPALRRATTQPSSTLRMQAIAVLGTLQATDPKAAAALLEFADDPNPQVAWAAMGNRAGAAADRKVFIREQLLSDRKGAKKWAAIKLREKPLAVDHLIELLEDCSSEVRKVADTTIDEVWRRSEWSPDALNSKNIRERKRAVALLGYLGNDQRYELIIAAMDDESVDVRLAAVGAAHRALTSSPVVLRLAEALRSDPSPAVRAKAAWALGDTKALPAAQDALAEAAKDSDPAVATAARDALTR